MSEISTTLVKTPPFLMWYDDNPKLSVALKIEAAIQAYCARFRGVQPTLVLVNEAELTEFAGVSVRAVSTVRRNTYWVGQDENAAPAQPEPQAASSPAPTRLTRANRRSKAS